MPNIFLLHFLPVRRSLLPGIGLIVAGLAVLSVFLYVRPSMDLTGQVWGGDEPMYITQRGAVSAIDCIPGDYCRHVTAAKAVEPWKPNITNFFFSRCLNDWCGYTGNSRATTVPASTSSSVVAIDMDCASKDSCNFAYVERTPNGCGSDYIVPNNPASSSSAASAGTCGLPDYRRIYVYMCFNEECNVGWGAGELILNDMSAVNQRGKDHISISCPEDKLCVVALRTSLGKIALYECSLDGTYTKCSELKSAPEPFGSKPYISCPTRDKCRVSFTPEGETAYNYFACSDALCIKTNAPQTTIAASGPITCDDAEHCTVMAPTQDGMISIRCANAACTVNSDTTKPEVNNTTFAASCPTPNACRTYNASKQHVRCSLEMCAGNGSTMEVFDKLPTTNIFDLSCKDATTCSMVYGIPEKNIQLPNLQFFYYCWQYDANGIGRECPPPASSSSSVRSSSSSAHSDLSSASSKKGIDPCAPPSSGSSAQSTVSKPGPGMFSSSSPCPSSSSTSSEPCEEFGGNTSLRGGGNFIGGVTGTITGGDIPPWFSSRSSTMSRFQPGTFSSLSRRNPCGSSSSGQEESSEGFQGCDPASGAVCSSLSSQNPSSDVSSSFSSTLSSQSSNFPPSSSAASSQQSSARPASSSQQPARCGDNIRQGNEQCDDGNLNDQDACSNACITARCGDGRIQPGEACDDGNQDDTDACNQFCELTNCGDTIKQEYEQCDDGNEASGDGCSSLCRLEQAAASSEGQRAQSSAGQAAQSSTRIANATSSATFNAVSASRISSAPTVAAASSQGQTQAPAQSSAPDVTVTSVDNPAFCGNGTLDSGEVCDQGRQNANTPDALCRADCTLARCGDGIRDTQEQCDDRNTLNGDGCSALCRIETTVAQALPASIVELPSAPTSQTQGYLTMEGGERVLVSKSPQGQWVDSRGTVVADAQGRVLASVIQGQVVTDVLGNTVVEPLYGGAYQLPQQTTESGPEVLVVMAGGAAAGYAWMRRRKMK